MNQKKKKQQNKGAGSPLRNYIFSSKIEVFVVLKPYEEENKQLLKPLPPSENEMKR